MQKQKCSLSLYTNFLTANHNRYSGVELSKSMTECDIAHDAVTRWLSSSNWTPSDLWNDVKYLVEVDKGYLIIDDTLLDKRYSRKNELAKFQYSGKEHKIVNGINLVNMIWTDKERFVPVDYRVYRKSEDDKTKNDHCKDMLKRAKQRHFSPDYVLMDSWYSSIDNLKYITKLGWNFIADLKSNRKVSVIKGEYISVADLNFADKPVQKVWLREYGFVLVVKIVHKNGDINYAATNDLNLNDYEKILYHQRERWKIEEYHRGLKQTTGIEKCYSTKAASQKTHIFSSIVAFTRMEKRRIKEKISWYEQKAQVSRMSTIAYMRANA